MYEGKLMKVGSYRWKKCWWILSRYSASFTRAGSFTKCKANQDELAQDLACRTLKAYYWYLEFHTIR